MANGFDKYNNCVKFAKYCKEQQDSGGTYTKTFILRSSGGVSSCTGNGCIPYGYKKPCKVMEELQPADCVPDCSGTRGGSAACAPQCAHHKREGGRGEGGEVGEELGRGGGGGWGEEVGGGGREVGRGGGDRSGEERGVGRSSSITVQGYKKPCKVMEELQATPDCVPDCSSML